MFLLVIKTVLPNYGPQYLNIANDLLRYLSKQHDVYITLWQSRKVHSLKNYITKAKKYKF